MGKYLARACCKTSINLEVAGGARTASWTTSRRAVWRPAARTLPSLQESPRARAGSPVRVLDSSSCCGNVSPGTRV